MTPVYGVPDEKEAIATIQCAPDLGVDFIDTSDAYGNGKNEELVGRALAGRRDRYVIATKFGNLRRPDGTVGVNGRPEYVAEACNASLKRLGTDYIDLYYIHRIDPDVPIEETVGAMVELVREGKIRTLGISEAGPQTIRRAHAVHPLSALQSEYSLWSRDVEGEILDVCEELRIGFVAYSPLGRGFLTGTITSLEQLTKGDRRAEMPRFAGEALAQNVRLVAHLKRLAQMEHCSPAQLALAWLLSREKWIVPIAGTSHVRWLEQNAAAADLAISPDAIRELGDLFRPEAVAGLRNNPAMMARMGL